MPANFNNQILFRSSSAASGDDNFTMLRTGIVYNAFGIANGATAGTVTVSKAGAAITDAININGGDKTLARAGSIDDANNSFAVGEVLRVAKSAAVSSDTFIYIAATGVSQ
tara:strand:+ start:257 stop:589 length:333 start_codon:yes stop_codon:yes gene_type:complete